jgi:uncharacterized membrane protein HdeD (DUF308 family)
MEVAKYAQVISLSATLGGLPLIWHNNRLHLTRDWRQLLKWAIYLLCTILFISYLFIRALLIYKAPYQSSRFHFLLCLTLGMVFICPFTYQLITLFRLNEILDAANAYLIYCEWFVGKKELIINLSSSK